MRTTGAQRAVVAVVVALGLGVGTLGAPATQAVELGQRGREVGTRQVALIVQRQASIEGAEGGGRISRPFEFEGLEQAEERAQRSSDLDDVHVLRDLPTADIDAALLPPDVLRQAEHELPTRLGEQSTYHVPRNSRSRLTRQAAVAKLLREWVEQDASAD